MGRDREVRPAHRLRPLLAADGVLEGEPGAEDTGIKTGVAVLGELGTALERTAGLMYCSSQ